VPACERPARRPAAAARLHCRSGRDALSAVAIALQQTAAFLDPNMSQHTSPVAGTSAATGPVGRLLLILGALAAFGPMSIDMYLPALPTIATEFHASTGAAQLTLSLYFIGAALSQLLYGPMSDRFGRRKPLIVGISLYIVTSGMAALASGIEQLIWLRLLQALGGAAGTVIARAVVRDLVGGDAAAKALSMLTLTMGAAPLLAPLIGGQILTWIGWRGIFWLLAIFGCGCLLSVLLGVPETHPPERRRPMSAGHMVTGYANVLANRRALGCLLTAGFAWSGMFAYISGTPFVYIEVFGVPPQLYGFLFGLNIVAIMSGAYVNSRVVMKVGRARLMSVGVAMAAAAGLTLLATGVSGFGGLIGIIVPLFFYMGSLNLTGANAIATVLDEFGHLAGTAAALFGLFQFGIGACAGALVGQLHDGTPLPMAAVIATTGVSALLFRHLLAR
jgi:MFS transporter, DHA1 family, multidrug resistance protein